MEEVQWAWGWAYDILKGVVKSWRRMVMLATVVLLLVQYLLYLVRQTNERLVRKGRQEC